MITFNLSVGDKNLPNDYPYQITPNSRAHLYANQLVAYKGNNPDIVIHVGYLLIPFIEAAYEPNSVIERELKLYQELARKIGSKYILIHLPRSRVEYSNFIPGLQLIVNTITDPDITILLELVHYTKDLQKLLYESCKSNDYKATLTQYMSNILPVIKELNDPRIKFVIDTAHIFSNNCITFDDYLYTYKLLKEHISDVIHLNGNIKGPFCSDEHIPFICKTPKNLLYAQFGESEYDLLIDHVFSHFRIVISENDFKKYNGEFPYSKYLKYAETNHLPIIPDSKHIPKEIVPKKK